MGQLIASRREEMQMNRTEPAQKMGVTDQVISQWEGDLSCPDHNSVKKLAAVPDISVEELTPSSADLPETTKKQI